MIDLLNNAKRTKMCGEFGAQDIGKEVTVMGFVSKQRDIGNLIFINVRDRTGIVQVSFNNASKSFEKAKTLKSEYVVCCKGVVKSRGENINKNIKTGEIEIIADELLILSQADTTPFEIAEYTTASELIRLKYRYLDLRRPSVQEKLIIRDKITTATREFMSQNNFLDIETPFLGKSTPEGARDYLVPSRVHQGQFYALPQSPQLYKQLLMIAGFDRYYQIARCFRDEDLRANRQPEFSQIDIEMSFVEKPEDVMEVAEGLIKHIFKKCKGIDLKGDFRKIKYQDAMDEYGSDKPDTRFEMKLVDLRKVFKNSEFTMFSDAIKGDGAIVGINLKDKSNSLSRKEIDNYASYAKSCGVNTLFWVSIKEDKETSSFLKNVNEEEKAALYKALDAKVGDVLFIISNQNANLAKEALGSLRIKLANDFNLVNDDTYDILWVVDFPLLEYDSEENRYVAVHHPFTSVRVEDIALLDKDPLKARANAYDLVINGQEAGGGSIRIHDFKMQQKMFELLGMSEQDIKDRFGFFVEAFKYGVPPHGGLAFGLDRLVMLLSKTDNIKDVIAFPKMQNASCAMSEAPSSVEERQLKELAIYFKDK